MAVMFVISYNVTLQDRKDESSQAVASSNSDIPANRKWWEVYGEKKDEEIVEKIEVDTSKKKMEPLEKGAFSRKK
jgi:hypothetical protein